MIMKWIDPDTVRWSRRTSFWVEVAELFTIFAFVHVALGSALAGARAGAEALISGPHAVMFWVGVIILGSVVPLLLNLLTRSHKILACSAILGIIGALVAIGNFAGICFVVQKVIDEPDEKKRKAQLQISYNTRMLLQALWIIIAIAAPCFQAFAGVLPLLFPRVTIYYLQITGKYKPLTPPQEPVDIAVEDDPAPAEASAVQPRDEGGEQE